MSKPSQCASERNDPFGIYPLFNHETGNVIGTVHNGKIIYDSGQLYTTEMNALAGSGPTPIIDSLRDKSRLRSQTDKELDLNEILLGEKKPKKDSPSTIALSGSSNSNRLTRQKSLTELLGGA